MKIIGLLSWYDEAPQWLSTAITGFARVCDQIVAVDGAFALYPGARPTSHPLQAEAVLSTAESAGVALTLHRPNALFWGNEVEKRNLTVKLASAVAAEGDWLIVFDADCHVFKCDPEVVRWELENTKADIGTYTYLEVEDFFSDPEMARIVKSDDYSTEHTHPTKDVYRWHPSLLYGPQHWTVSREYTKADGSVERRWLRHTRKGPERQVDLGAHLVIYHRSRDRAMIRQEAKDEYYRARDLHGVENMVAGDPHRNGVGV